MLETLKSRKEELEKRGKKGFTLMEMLIVIAIIAVLIAIAIPIFTAQLEKAREATDEANMRSLYAEAVAAVLIEDTGATTSIPSASLTVTKTGGVCTGVATYTLTQQADGLEGNVDSINIGGIEIDADNFGPGKTATITVTTDGTTPTITIG